MTAAVLRLLWVQRLRGQATATVALPEPDNHPTDLQWDIQYLVHGPAIAFCDGISVNGTFYVAGPQVDLIEADVLRLLAAITAHRALSTEKSTP